MQGNTTNVRDQAAPERSWVLAPQSPCILHSGGCTPTANPTGPRCIGCLANGRRIEHNRVLPVEPAARAMNVALPRSEAPVVDEDDLGDSDFDGAHDQSAVWSPMWVQVDPRASGGRSNWASRGS